MGGRGAVSSFGKAKARAAARKPVQRGHLQGSEIPGTPEKTAAYLGVSVDVAKELHGSVRNYSGSSYSAIRQAQRTGKGSAQALKDAKNIETYIEHAPKWAGGTTYRGIKLDAATVKALRVGDKIDVNSGTASWSTAESTARSFSGSGYAGTGKKSVIFVSGTQTKGTSIKHISHYSSENEVLVSKRTQYIIDSISIKPGSPYTYVYVKEK